MSRPTRRHALRAATVLRTAGTAVLATAAPALAHVTAQPGTAEQGGHSVVTLRVPTESDTAGTVALPVSLPTDHPITSVRTTPRAGWTATLTRVPLDPPVQPHHGGAGLLVGAPALGLGGGAVLRTRKGSTR